MTRVRLNGDVQEIARPELTEVLRALGLQPDAPGVAVALNGEVVRRGSWAATMLHDGDEIEVLTAVQGG